MENLSAMRPGNNLLQSSRRKEAFLRNTIKTLHYKVMKLEKDLIEARHFANHDLLTGLANRGLLRDRLLQSINQANRQGKQVGLLILDLNGFKSINDTYGHNIGDEVLIQMARRLIACVRAEDSTYRYGGDEFVVLLPEVDGIEGANELKKKLLEKLAVSYKIGRISILAPASIGVAVYPTDGKNQMELINHADENMYTEKTKSNGFYTNNSGRHK
ncbi:GGDEF domain-containing protein [Simiduia sp. 21SJ11W-1]|uniref:GGDEF domain-containing protein n=1 Tax=Simiduia sp. 21SJ11W-1 TaxID=2909669 RepID=UPI00209DF9D5|nr:GGDEF domain-containing protein [Simiduia sp. 21SJ11W-1]UTA48934.1 GGDEF domain-containing protein [Simiduia sp. 21SJ11W-1]